MKIEVVQYICVQSDLPSTATKYIDSHDFGNNFQL